MTSKPAEEGKVMRKTNKQKPSLNQSKKQNKTQQITTTKKLTQSKQTNKQKYRKSKSRKQNVSYWKHV